MCSLAFILRDTMLELRTSEPEPSSLLGLTFVTDMCPFGGLPCPGLESTNVAREGLIVIGIVFGPGVKYDW